MLAVNGSHISTQAAVIRPLHRAQLRPEKLVQRFLLAVLANPKRLARLQIAHHRQKLLRLSQIDLIHAHLP